MNADQLTSSIADAIYRYSSHKATEQRKSNHIRLHGLSICIETPKGHRRRPDWPEMPADYGYIKRTEGADGDAVDVFIGPHQKSEMVYVIDQCSKDGTFDEHKVMLGYTNYNKAVDAYKAAYTKGWKVGKVTAMTIEQFKNWLKDGNKNTQIQHQVSRYSLGDETSNPVYQSPMAQQASEFQRYNKEHGSPWSVPKKTWVPYAEAQNRRGMFSGIPSQHAITAHNFIKQNFGPQAQQHYQNSSWPETEHMLHVAHALNNGQQIPLHVLADYPDDLVPGKSQEIANHKLNARAKAWLDSGYGPEDFSHDQSFASAIASLQNRLKMHKTQQHIEGQQQGDNALADQMFQGLPHQFKSNNPHHADRNWRPPQNRQGGSGEVTPYSALSAIPPIADGQTRLTHFFANPDLKKKFLSGEPFQYHKQGVISGTTDAFSNNNDVQGLLETGKVGAWDRRSFGDHVLIMDVPHMEHRLHDIPQWADGQLHNGHIAGVYDRQSGQFHSNPAYGTAPQYKPANNQLPTHNRPNASLHASLQSHSFNTPIPQPSAHQTVRPDDVFSMRAAAAVEKYSSSSEIRANLTDEQHKGIGESFSAANASPGGYFHPQMKTLSNHGVHKDQMLTGDDQNLILFHAGVLGHDAIGKHLYGENYESFLDGSQPEMRAGDFNFRLASALNKHGSSVKKAEGEKRAAGARVISFKASDGQRLLLHPAVRSDRTSDWQLSYIGSDGRPSGHSNPESFQHGLHQALGVYHHPYYNHHGFDIEWTDRDGTKAPYQLRADIDRYAEFQQLGLFDDIPSGSHFEEKKHPRWKAGDQAHHGGQFAPKSKAHQPNLFETHGHPDQKWLFGDEGVHGDMVLTPSEPEPAPPPAPIQQPQSQGIIQPPASIPNDQAKPGQQLGLFGDAPMPKTNPPKIDIGSQPKAKQGNLFDTHGNANQMDFFGDGVMSDDLVYKPDNPAMGIPKRTNGLGGFMRGESQPLPKPQVETPQAASFADDPKEPVEAERPAINPMARPEDPEHADHHLSLAESPKADGKDDRFTREINDPRTRKYLLGVAMKMTNDPHEAEDAVQDAMTRAFMNKHKYNPEESFMGWMQKILRNTQINKHRDKAALKRGGGVLMESMDAPAGSIEYLTSHDFIGSNARIGKPDVSQDEREAFGNALPQLPEKHRRVIELALQGNSKREIAKEMNFSEQRAGKLHEEALVMLKKLIAKTNYVLDALIERYCQERDADYYAMCLRVYRYSVFGEIDRYEFTEEDHPRVESGKSEGGEFSTKMHNGTPIPDRPASISANHSLHLSSVAKNPGTLGIASKLANVAKGLRAIGNDAQAKHEASQSSESASGSPYDHVDWGKVQGHLDEVNQLHKQSLADGHNVANIANYNGVIPKWLIPRLASGRKFVDPSMLGAKWTKDTPQPMQAPKDPEHGFQTGWNSKWQPGNEHRGYNSADEARQAALGHSQKKPGMQFAIAQHPEGLWYVAHRELPKPPAQPQQMPQAPSQVQSQPQPQPPQQPQQPQTQPQAQPQQPQSRFMGDGRVFNAGMNRGTIGFENELHRDLYDLGARIRNNNRRNNHFNPQDEKQTESLERRISSHPEIQKLLQSGQLDPNGLRNLAINTHEYAKEQMRGLKEGEHRQPKMLPMMKPDQQQPSPQQPPQQSPQPQSLDDKILQHLEKNPNTDIHALGDAVGVKPSGYGQAWDSSELNKSLRRLRDAGKIQSPQDKPGSWGAPRFSLVQQPQSPPQPASIPQAPSPTSTPQQAGPHDLDEFGNDATPEMRAQYDRLNEAVKGIAYSPKEGFRSEEDKRRWHDLTNQLDSIYGKLSNARKQKELDRQQSQVRALSQPQSRPSLSVQPGLSSQPEPPAQDAQGQPPKSQSDLNPLLNPGAPKELDSSEGFESEDARWAEEDKRERAALEELWKNMNDPGHPKYDPFAQDPRWWVNKNNGASNPQEPPSGLSMRRFKNVKDAIRERVAKTVDDEKQNGLTDDDIAKIAHLAWGMYGVAQQEHSRAKELDKSLAPSDIADRQRAARKAATDAFLEDRKRIEQDQSLTQEQKESAIQAAEERRQSLESQLMKRAERAARGARNLKRGRMRKTAQGSFDPDSAQRQRRDGFEGFDSKVESLLNEYPEFLSGDKVVQPDQKLFEVIAGSVENLPSLKNHEEVLDQAIDEYLQSLENKPQGPDLDHVPFSAYFNAQIQRYSARLSLQHSLEKSLQKFCNKAS